MTLQDGRAARQIEATGTSRVDIHDPLTQIARHDLLAVVDKDIHVRIMEEDEVGGLCRIQ